MFTKKSLNVPAIPLSSEVPFSTTEEIPGSLNAFPFSSSVIFVCNFTFFEKTGFTFLQKVFLPVTSRI